MAEPATSLFGGHIVVERVEAARFAVLGGLFFRQRPDVVPVRLGAAAKN